MEFDIKKEINKRAIAILRVSSIGQKDNTSHESQYEMAQKYCKELGLKLIRTVKITESAKSSGNRKHYRKVQNEALADGIRHFIFYMYDRETRNLTDNEANENLVREDKIVLHYGRDRKVLHKNSPDADFMLRDIQAATNKQYSRNIATKVRDAARYKASLGWYPYNTIPKGYMFKSPTNSSGSEIRGAMKTIVPTDDELELSQVKREYELRASGHSFASIRSIVLKEKLILPSKVANYSKSSIEGRLKNKFYRGYFDHEGIEYKGKHELIIPKPILAAVVQSFESGPKVSTRTGGGLLSGWLKCSHQNCNMSIIYDPKKKKLKSTGETKTFHYYHCSNQRRVHKSMKGMSLSEDKILDQFQPALTDISISEGMAQDIADALNRIEKEAVRLSKKQASEYKKAIRSLEGKEDKMFDLLMEGTINKEDYNRHIKRIRAEKENYEDLFTSLTLEVNGAAMRTAVSILELATNAESLWKTATKEERVQRLKQVCSNQVFDGTTVEYELKKPFAVLAKMKGLDEWLLRTGSNRRQGD